MLSRSIHVAACSGTSSPCMAEYYSLAWLYHPDQLFTFWLLEIQSQRPCSSKKPPKDIGEPVAFLHRLDQEAPSPSAYLPQGKEPL